MHVQDDDGFIVYESRAIARYIAAKAASPFLPTGEAKKAALFEQAASIEVSNFDSFASGIPAQHVLAPQRGLATDEARVAELATTLEIDVSEAINSYMPIHLMHIVSFNQ
jgi:glutathione S-transferase